MKETSKIVPLHRGVSADPELEKLLDDVHGYLSRFISFPDERCFTAVTLWVAHTWVANSFHTTPRLILDSPEPGSGKTRVLELLNYLCHKPKFTFSITPAALFRIINSHDNPPTLLQDEADAIFGRGAEKTQDIRALFNAGYKQGSTIDRVSADEVISYQAYAPVALAGIAGNMPDTITTRAITIHMRRRKRSEHVEAFKERDANHQTAGYKAQFETWANRSRANLAHHNPVIPEGVRDRSEEIWEPLLAIAENASPAWAKEARDACRWFVIEQRASNPRSEGVQLLHDIKLVMGKRTKIHTQELAELLVDLEEGQWSELFKGNVTTAGKRISLILGKYGVRPKVMRLGGELARGYEVSGTEGLAEAWDRYL